MPRQARIDAPRALQHIIVRGVERQRIFGDDEDREAFLARLGRLLEGSSTACLAWTLMPNHVHLLLTPKIHPSHALQRLKGTSAREANTLLCMTGRPFWQDESYDRLVRNPTEFDRIDHYILQNPVRAGLARVAEEYRWSSAFKSAANQSLP